MSERRVILTGGSPGIGADVCRTLLEEGFEVINVALQPASFTSPRLENVVLDLTDAVATREKFLELAATKPATTLIHCAGAIRERLLEEATLEDLDALAHLHLGAALSLVKANLAAMKAAHYGAILFFIRPEGSFITGQTLYVCGGTSVGSIVF